MVLLIISTCRNYVLYKMHFNLTKCFNSLRQFVSVLSSLFVPFVRWETNDISVPCMNVRNVPHHSARLMFSLLCWRVSGCHMLRMRHHSNLIRKGLCCILIIRTKQLLLLSQACTFLEVTKICNLRQRLFNSGCHVKTQISTFGWVGLSAHCSSAFIPTPRRNLFARKRKTKQNIQV